jgi:hypothetical protein
VPHRAGARAALGVVLAAFSSTVTGSAQELERASAGLVMSSTLERIVAAPGSDGAAGVAIVPGTVASHADQLIVSVRFSNTSGQSIDSIRITSPVPADVQYVPQSAAAPGGDVVFSIDNGMRFAPPNELTVVAPNGTRRSADPAEYTHVRWVLRAPLDAGATGIARFRAVPR